MSPQLGHVGDPNSRDRVVGLTNRIGARLDKYPSPVHVAGIFRSRSLKTGLVGRGLCSVRIPGVDSRGNSTVLVIIPKQALYSAGQAASISPALHDELKKYTDRQKDELFLRCSIQTDR